MNFAYDWAFAKPVRKVYYNMTITGLSVFVAVFIGAIELLGLVTQDSHLNGSFWSLFGELQHQHGRLRHRRGVRSDLDHRPVRLALRPHRAKMGRRAPSHRGYVRLATPTPCAPLVAHSAAWTSHERGT